MHLVQNQSENGKYNLISVLFNKISKRFLCVQYTCFQLKTNRDYGISSDDDDDDDDEDNCSNSRARMEKERGKRGGR